MTSKSVSESIQPSTAEQQKQQLEAARMHEVQVLIDVLFRREAEVLKLVINHLYDVGSTNLIDQRVTSRQLRGIVKYIAKLSKPAFRCVALYWVQKNCPRLVTNWLRYKVAFKTYVPPAPTIVETVDQAQETVEKVLGDDSTLTEDAAPTSALVTSATRSLPPSTLLKLNAQHDEIQTLRFQVRVFAGMALAAIAILGGTIAYLSYRLEVTPIQLLHPAKTTAVKDAAPPNCEMQPAPSPAISPVTSQSATLMKP